MSNYGSADVGFILVGGYSLLGSVTALQDSVEAILDQLTALGDSWTKFGYTGLKKGALSQNGFFDDAAGQVNAALVDNQGDSHIYCHNLEGNVIGKRFVGYAGAIEAKYDRVAQLGKFTLANAAYNPSDAIETGRILHALGTEAAASGDTTATPVDRATDTAAVRIPITSSSVANPSHIITPVPHGLLTNDYAVIAGHVGSTPDVNNEYQVTVISPVEFTIPVNVTVGGTGGYLIASATKDGGSGYVQIPALTLGGYTDVVFKVRHSQNGAAWADLGTFTAIAGPAPTAARLVVAAGTTVNRHLAMSWAYGGAGAGQSVNFMLGFARK